MDEAKRYAGLGCDTGLSGHLGLRLALSLGLSVLAGLPLAALADAPENCSFNSANFIPAYTKLSPDDVRVKSSVGIDFQGDKGVSSCSAVLLASTQGSSDQGIRILTAGHCIHSAYSSITIGMDVPVDLYWYDYGGPNGPFEESAAANPGEVETLKLAAYAFSNNDAGIDYAILVGNDLQHPPPTAYFSAWDAGAQAINVGDNLTSLGFPGIPSNGTTSTPEMQYIHGNVAIDDGDFYGFNPIQGCVTVGTSGSPYYRDSDLYDIGLLAAVFTHIDPNGNQSSNLSTIIPLRNVLADANAAAVLDPGKTGATMAAGYASTGPYIAYSVNGVPNKVTNYAYVGFHTGKFGITFGWTTQNADSCQASGAWSGPQPVSGSYHIPADTPAGDYFYYLTCTQASTGLQIQGYAQAHVMPPNSVDISVSPSTIMTGQTATLSWQQVGDNGICNASGDWSGSQPLSGSMTVGPFSQPGTHVYTLTCEGAETASNSATLTVTGTGGGSSGGSSSGGSSGSGSSSGGSGGSRSSGGGAVDPGLLAVLAGLLLLRLTPRKQEVRKMIRTISFALALAAVGFEPEASAQSPTVPGQDPADQAWKGPSAVTPHGRVKVCPQVALRCPDGSFTGYQGPNCELVPCPAGTDKARKATPSH